MYLEYFLKKNTVLKFRAGRSIPRGSSETEEISHKLRKRSDVYTELEKKLNVLPEIYGREIEDVYTNKKKEIYTRF